jgi:uracil-DNA glycosylase
MFRWLHRIGVDEATFRSRVYIAAVTRCYPGPHPSGRGDRVPSRIEQEQCSGWLESELRIIRPTLLIPVGKLAIEKFLAPAPLDRIVGRVHEVEHTGGRSRAIPLPHPSGASSWVNAPANRKLLERALDLIGAELATIWGADALRRSA